MTQPIHTTSTASMQSFGTTGAGSAGASTGGWSSLSTTKTASFSTIQKEVNQTVTYSPGHTYKAYNPAEEAAQTLYTEQPHGPRRAPGPGGPAIGEDKPGSPIGDMLIPMFVIALGYIVVKLFRNRKTSQAL